MTRNEIVRRRCEIAGEKGISDFAMGAFIFEISNLFAIGQITSKEVEEFTKLLKYDRAKYAKYVDEYLAFEDEIEVDD
ncbi:MAG TPA: hypothetical protein PLE30_11320 [Candidatus Kapabacteria bacterium]|nr:hypothetical protein [Candidatus Kapabacteria bacterium]